MADNVRAALAELTTAERTALAARMTRDGQAWEAVGSGLGPVWRALAALVLAVDRDEQARRAAEVRPAGPSACATAERPHSRRA